MNGNGNASIAAIGSTHTLLLLKLIFIITWSARQIMTRIDPSGWRGVHLANHSEGWICFNCKYKFKTFSPSVVFAFHFDGYRSIGK